MWLPASGLNVVAPETPVSLLIPRLAGADPEQQLPVPVVRAGHLMGLIDVEQLRELIDLEEEFGLLSRRVDAEIPAEAQQETITPAQAAMPLLEREANR